MTIELQYKIQSDNNLQKFLRENSYWYKDLNRDPTSFKYFVTEMKDKYKLKPSDKFNKMLNDISMFQSFLDILK